MGSEPNQEVMKYRIGLDKLQDQRDRIAGMDIPDTACSDFRDAVVLAFDILTQVLGEHFPLIRESTPNATQGAIDA